MIYISYSLLVLLLFAVFGIKWEVRFKFVLPWSILMAILGCISLYFVSLKFPMLSIPIKLVFVLLQAGVLTVATILILFFRDPERYSPSGEGIILAPADGEIIYVKEIRKGEFPFALKKGKKIPLKDFINDDFIKDRGVQIGILMTYINVHVNRTPIDGRVERMMSITGNFNSLKNLESLLENERLFTLISGKDMRIGIVQIASRVVRRIVPFIKEGDNVQIGQRMGVIRFGSQVDVLIPYKERLHVQVGPKDEVRAGLTIIATY